jgi:hypothetical protein
VKDDIFWTQADRKYKSIFGKLMVLASAKPADDRHSRLSITTAKGDGFLRGIKSLYLQFYRLGTI